MAVRRTVAWISISPAATGVCGASAAMVASIRIIGIGRGISAAPCSSIVCTRTMRTPAPDAAASARARASATARRKASRSAPSRSLRSNLMPAYRGRAGLDDLVEQSAEALERVDADLDDVAHDVAAWHALAVDPVHVLAQVEAGRANRLVRDLLTPKLLSDLLHRAGVVLLRLVGLGRAGLGGKRHEGAVGRALDDRPPVGHDGRRFRTSSRLSFRRRGGEQDDGNQRRKGTHQDSSFPFSRSACSASRRATGSKPLMARSPMNVTGTAQPAAAHQFVVRPVVFIDVAHGKGHACK